MTVVYIIIISGKECYSEHALISIYSLRKHNPQSKVVVLTDSESMKMRNANYGRLKALVDDIICPELPEGLTSIQKSRFIKTTLPNIIDGEFLYIDNDTIITSDISEIQNFAGEIGMVYNQHKRDWTDVEIHPMLAEYHNKTGVIPEIDNLITDFYNGGIILCKNNENSKRFFSEWHKLWKVSSFKYNYSKDQPDLWRTNFLMNNLITPIDNIWNCQLLHLDKCVPYILTARIFHYFSSVNYLPDLFINSYDFLSGIRKKGITCEDEKLIDNFINEYFESIKKSFIRHKEFPLKPMAFLGNELSRRFPIADKIGLLILKLFGINL